MSSSQSSSRRHEAGNITCIHCKLPISGQAWGTQHRNHCPACLFSRHVDEQVGDRRSPCRQPMRPIGIEVKPGAHSGEWSLIHRCEGCGVIRVNRIAGDDSERSLLALALRPLASPAFPLDDPRT